MLTKWAGPVNAEQCSRVRASSVSDMPWSQKLLLEKQPPNVAGLTAEDVNGVEIGPSEHKTGPLCCCWPKDNPR